MMTSTEFQASYIEAARDHFAAFAPRLNPALLLPESSPDRIAFDLAHSIGREGGPLPDADGLYLFGRTGTGKSCCALALAWRSVLSTAREVGKWLESRAPYLVPSYPFADRERAKVKFRQFHPYDFQLWAASALKDEFASVCRDPEAKEELVEDLTSAEVLLLDDLGHVLSPSFAENLRIVLDRWQGDLLLITGQYAPDELIRRWSRADAKADMREQAEALVRRIGDLCAGLNFVRRKP